MAGSPDSSAIGAAQPQEDFCEWMDPRQNSTFSQNTSCACRHTDSRAIGAARAAAAFRQILLDGNRRVRHAFVHGERVHDGKFFEERMPCITEQVG